MVTTLAPDPKAIPIVGEKRVTLRGITWQGYQEILRALPDNRSARLTI